MFAIYFLMFWVPAAASAVLLVVAWKIDLVDRPVFLSGVFLLALMVQFKAGLFSPVWLAAFTIQAVLALYLAIKLRLA